MSGKVGTATVFVAIVLLGTVPASAQICLVDVCVRFDPSSDVVLLGETFEVDIVAEIVTPVVGWGLDLDIDAPSVISLSGSPDISLPWDGITGFDGDGLAALANPFTDADNNGVNGSVSGTDIVLVTLTFVADAEGHAELSLSDDNPFDLTEGFPLDGPGFAEVTYELGFVWVVPEPWSVWPVMMGALVLCGGRRRRRT